MISWTNEPCVILGIHGLENKPPLDEKTRWWKAAITEGLKRNCGWAEGEIPFEFVYWADLRYEQPVVADENDEPYHPDPGTGPFPRHDPGDHAPVSTLLGQLYEGLDKLQIKTGITPVDDIILKTRFDDLWHYHSETEFARKVRGRLCERIESLSGQRILLAAHSMGSIIAYDALRSLERDAPSARIAHFVTLGSPLGLAEVKLKIAAEHGACRTPNNIGDWTNLTDKRDVATVTGALAEDYAPNDYGVHVHDVAVLNEYQRLNGNPNHHKSYGYLRTPEFSEISLNFVSSAMAERLV